MNCPGEWEGMFNSVEKLILVYYWDVDQQIGRKYVLSNAYQRISRKHKVGFSNAKNSTIISPTKYKQLSFLHLLPTMWL